MAEPTASPTPIPSCEAWLLTPRVTDNKLYPISWMQSCYLIFLSKFSETITFPLVANIRHDRFNLEKIIWRNAGNNNDVPSVFKYVDMKMILKWYYWAIMMRTMMWYNDDVTNLYARMSYEKLIQWYDEMMKLY